MDSTMMWIVHQAMNNAHEKMQSKEGVLERLNVICRFYELAVMQLEGCLKFVRQEIDRYILESSHEQLLEDLTEIRNRLQGRLKESEMAIKAKDVELASLRARTDNLKIERRTRSEPVEEYILGKKITDEDDVDRDNEFSELKNSVDQQVWNIRQKLEPDYKFKDKEGNAEVVEGVHNKRIEQMDSDMGILKETLDLAFEKMQNAIYKTEPRPLIEQQWTWSVEKDTMSVVLEGFMTDWNQEMQVSLGLKEFWSDLMNEVANLRNELESFVAQNEMPGKIADSLQTSLGNKVPNKTNEKPAPDDFSHGKPEKERSLKAEEATEELHEEATEEEGGNFVSKMIKNHESIIQKKSAEAEELSLLKREILRQKWNLCTRKEEIGMQENSLKRKVRETIIRLDKFTQWDAKLSQTFDNHKFGHEEETLLEKRFLKSGANSNENLELDTLEDVWEKMDKVHYAVNEEQRNEEKMLKQEQDENLKAVIMEQTYVTLLESVIEENYVELYDYELENLIGKDICSILLAEVVNQWKENFESYSIESQTREEIYCTVLREVINNYGSKGNFALVECENLRAKNKFLKGSADEVHYLEGTIREVVCCTLLQEMCKEWNACIDGYEIVSLLRQDIDWLTFSEMIEGIVHNANDPLVRCQDTVTGEFLCSIESFVREDICMVFIRESIKEWKMELSDFKMEGIIKEELYQFVIAEALKDAFDLFREPESGNQEHNSPLDLVALDCEEETNESDISIDLLPKGHTFSCVSSKLANKAPRGQLEPSDSVLAPVLRFSEEFVDFEHTTKEQLEMNFLRLDKMKHHLTLVPELVSALRKKESLYRDAFTRRCQDLWKAETEVDLLGDQVDALVGLLEKIYTTLRHHSPVLQQHSEVSDILQLIKKELTGIVNASNSWHVP